MPIPRIIPYLESSDFAAVEDFYVGVLGLDATTDVGDENFLGLNSPDNHSAQIVVSAPGAEAPQPAFGIDVGAPAAVEAAHAAALARELEVVYPLTDEPWGIRRFFVRDPTGAVVSILAHAS